MIWWAKVVVLLRLSGGRGSEEREAGFVQDMEDPAP